MMLFHNTNQILDENNLPSYYEGKKIFIRNRTYICLEELKNLSHIDQKNYSVRAGLYIQPNSWIVQACYDRKYYIVNGYKVTKTSPYYLYNHKTLPNGTSIEKLLEECGVYQEALRYCA